MVADSSPVLFLVFFLLTGFLKVHTGSVVEVSVVVTALSAGRKRLAGPMVYSNVAMFSRA